nr:hypothetical protein BaRGS_017134 [Batillaria attramentaria]
MCEPEARVPSLAVLDKFEAFYTGGKLQVSKDGKFMFCGCGQKVKVVDVDTGKIQSAIGQEDEEITAFCLSPDDQFLVLSTQTLLLRQWNWKDERLIRSWKAVHFTPVMSMAFDPTSTLLATGGSDTMIKLWDIVQQYCTHNLRGHSGVVRLVQFHPDISRLQLVSAADDYTVRVWDLKTSACKAVIRDHYSLVKDINFTNNGNTMYSCGGDSVVCVWDMQKLAVVKTLPVFESMEAVLTLEHLPVLDVENPGAHFVTVGTAGALRVWNANTGNCAYSNKSLCEEIGGDDGEARAVIMQSLYCEAQDKIIVVTYDHNILYLNSDFTLHRQFSGHLEEVLDLALIGNDGSHVVVISNSSKVKVFCRQTMECQILPGHADTVLSVSACLKKHLFATSSKDNSVRVWKFDPATTHVTCVAVGQGHTQAVHSVAFSRLSAHFLVSGSEDSTLKLWTVPAEKEMDSGRLATLHTSSTERAHEKDINFVAVAPNDQFLASASQDKTAKLWSLPDMSLQGVARGHKRGVWCVQFSPEDRVFATSSADGTIKLWNLADFSCLQTFEGHDSSVLKVLYISKGKQLISSDSEGLLKLWTIKTNVCEKTFDAHEAKAWALTVHPSEQFILSGAADSTFITWKDVTDEEIKLAKETQEKLVLQEQQLSNYIQEKKFLKAIGLAISLEQPFRVLTILKDILQTSTGYEDLKTTLSKLKNHQIGALLRYAAQWNTNSRHCHCAQVVVNIVLNTFTPDQLMALPDFQASLEALIPYTGL